MPKKWNQKEIIQKFIEKHSLKFSYKKFIYVGFKIPSIIICNIHQREFKQTPEHHLKGKYNCPDCKSENQSKSRKKSIKKLISDFIKVHGNLYDYSLITEENYINNKTSVPIICPDHGTFYQRPNEHLQSKGCKYCQHQSFPNSLEYVIKNIQKIHPEYDLSLITEYKNNKSPLPIICPDHGLFYKNFNAITTQFQGCPICKKSKGELLIFNYLTSKKLLFISQHKFEGCRSPLYRNIRLPFDFYLPDYNTCIEFDGRHHFEPVDFSHGSMSQKEIQQHFKNTQINDSIKTQYCVDNNIKLIRIPYWKFKNIPNILKILI